MKTVVKFNKPSCMRIALSGVPNDHVDLMTGVNEVDAEKWARAAEDSIVKWYIDEGHIEVVKSGLAATAYPLKGLATLKAAKLVKETFTAALLKSWREAERRPPVLSVIDKQLALLQLPPKEKETDADHVD